MSSSLNMIIRLWCIDVGQQHMPILISEKTRGGYLHQSSPVYLYRQKLCESLTNGVKFLLADCQLMVTWKHRWKKRR